MNEINNNPSVLRKTAAVIVVSLLGMSAAQANVFSGTIYSHTAADASGVGSTVDYLYFSLASAANIVLDVRANEGYTSGWGQHPDSYIDLNGDGEITIADTQFRVFQDTVSLDTEVISADDSPAYTIPGNTDGWADGSLNTRDSYLSTALDAGNYIIALGDYALTSVEAVAGFNAGDALTGATGVNTVTGAIGQNHFDYQLTLTATDYATGAVLPVSLTASPVPVPGAVWLFGSTLAGFLGLRRRKLAA
jgi:hypothetical protein